MECRRNITDVSLTWRTSGESPERRRLARDVTRAFDVGGEGGNAVADEVVGLAEDGQVDDGEVRVGVEDADLRWKKTIANTELKQTITQVEVLTFRS